MKCRMSEAMVCRIQVGQVGLRQGTALKLAGALEVPPFHFYMIDSEPSRWGNQGSMPRRRHAEGNDAPRPPGRLAVQPPLTAPASGARLPAEGGLS